MRRTVTTMERDEKSMVHKSINGLVKTGRILRDGNVGLGNATDELLVQD